MCRDHVDRTSVHVLREIIFKPYLIVSNRFGEKGNVVSVCLQKLH